MSIPIIVGANLTGLCLAAALSNLNQASVLIDRRDISFVQKDFRAIALSYGSKQILDKIGLWEKLKSHAGPIKEIRVTDQYSPLFLHFDKNETLGYLIEAHIIYKVMYEHIKDNSLVKIISETTYELLENNYSFARLKINDKEYKTDLILAADGKFSNLRKLANIEHSYKSYHQKGIACRIKHQKPHHAIAQEIFLPSGPFAVLPLKNQHESGIVWTENHQNADCLTKLDEKKFLYLLNNKMQHFLGEIELSSNVMAFPLELILAKKYYSKRIVLVGDAAHSIHPIAGQGFNLALRDIDLIMQLYTKYKNIGFELGCSQSLKEYENIRKNDNLNMAIITDGLEKLFSNNYPIISSARKIGLSIVNKIPALKNFFMEYAMAKK